MIKVKTGSRQQDGQKMPGHTRTHTQMGGHVANIMPSAAYRMDGGGIIMERGVSLWV